MKNLLLVLLITTQYFCHAQIKEQPEFGKISHQEIEMSSYEKDPSAKAVVLFDIGRSKFIKEGETSFKIRFTRHKRIKIFDKSIEDQTEVTLGYSDRGFEQTERYTEIKASTFNYSNGRVVEQPVKVNSIFDEQITEKYHRKKFVFPNVQDGSILDLWYVFETPFKGNLPDWEFQAEIPTVHSEYEVGMIPFYEYTFYLQGIKKFDKKSVTMGEEKRQLGVVAMSYGKNLGSGVEFQDQIHNYAMYNVPAFKDQSFITSKNDYIKKIDFQLSRIKSTDGSVEDFISTWPDLNKELLKFEEFGKYLKGCSKLSKNILEEELNIANLSETEKSSAIIDYVKNSFTWNGYMSKYANKSPKDFYKAKTGNSAEINLFLIGMLQEAGINAQPLILSTRNHGKLNVAYPFDHFTNYVIALVETDRLFLADGTEDLLPFDRIPTRCINERGLIVSDDKEPKWIQISNTIPSMTKTIIKHELKPELAESNISVTVQCTEYDAYQYRDAFKDDAESMKEYFSEESTKIDRLKSFSYDQINAPYMIGFEGTHEIEVIADNLVLKPFMGLTMDENPLKAKTRDYPVDVIYPSNNIFEVSIQVPDGYTLNELPDTIESESDLITVAVNYTLTGNDLKIVGNYDFKKQVYTPNEYPRIKNALDLLVRKFNEELVFEKI